MPNLSHTIEQLWHDHPGARWLVPMIALLAFVIIGLLVMLVYPYVSA